MSNDKWKLCPTHGEPWVRHDEGGLDYYTCGCAVFWTSVKVKPKKIAGAPCRSVWESEDWRKRHDR